PPLPYTTLFRSGGVEEVGRLVADPGHLEPTSATAVGGLDGDRQAVLVREGEHLLGAVDGVRRPGDQRGAGGAGDVPGAHLVAQGADGGGWRADPGEPGIDDLLGELGVLGEEAVAGVDGVGTAAARDV